MGITNLELLDLNYLINICLVLVIFGVFYYAISQKQRQAMRKVDESLKRQLEANQHLNLIVKELRRSNRFLAELADVEPLENERDHLPPVAQVLSQTTEPSAENSQYKLYVGNIDYTATETELADYFSQYGLVEFVNIPVNRYNGRARGFGFVSFSSKQDAERAMALHGTEFKGRQIQVNFAKERDVA